MRAFSFSKFRQFCQRSSSVGTAAHKGKDARVCVIGAGPAGLSLVHRLFRRLSLVSVDVLERLPVPSGLIRYGVAPDHPDAKNIERKLLDTAKHRQRVRLLCHVEVGKDVTLSELRSQYSAVVVATGAGSEHRLDIPGESRGGVHGAKDVVMWYNGYPDHNLELQLDRVKDVVIIGNGNVALDLARILLRPVEDLRRTDIPEPVLEELAKSQVKRVHIVGRRGPAQASWSPRELREILFGIRGCKFHLSGGTLKVSQSDFIELQTLDNQWRQSSVNLFRKKMSQMNEEKVPEEAKRHVYFHFLASPMAFLPRPPLSPEEDEDHVGGVRFRSNTITGKPFEQQLVPSESEFIIPCQLAIRSIGYNPMVIPELPVDLQNGRLHVSFEGRVLNSESDGELSPLPGLYATGWAKGGARGSISLTNMDAETVAATMASDYDAGLWKSIQEDSPDPLQRLREGPSPPLAQSQWSHILDTEEKRGSKLEKPREKITSISEMLEVAKSRP